MKNPDAQVGENIIVELKKERLLSEAALDKLKPKLITGSLSSSDWRLAFEAERPENARIK